VDVHTVTKEKSNTSRKIILR